MSQVEYRVDNVPIFWRPFFWFYGYGLGFFTLSFIRLVGWTVRVKVEGSEHLSPDHPYIFAMWHSHNFPAFVSDFFRRTGKRFTLLNHPAWYMKPVHLILYFRGVEKLVLGSTGHGGREAAAEVVEDLKKGASTHINPDGPAGPPRVLKKGVLHMAQQSGVPIVPVKFICSRELVLRKTWDGKRIPLPWSDITIEFGEPIAILEADFEQGAKLLMDQLS